MILLAEWQRFLRQRGPSWMLAGACLLLMASALWSGWQAQTLRAAQATQLQQDRIEMAAAHNDARTRQSATPDPKKAASTAYAFASKNAPAVILQPGDGLVLSVQQFARLDAMQHLTLESRHTDARRNEPIVNPLLHAGGVPDFAVVLALLLPLLVIGLCHGLVLEDREQGRWRLLLAQSSSPGRVLAVGLLIRAAAVAVLALWVSALAFASDGQLFTTAFGMWIALVLAYIAFWTCLCGVASLLAWSAGSASVFLITAWLLMSFVIPGVATQWLDHVAPMPSRLQAIVQTRAIQQDAEVRMDALVQRWYVEHPQWRPAGIDHHDWPVSFLPRYLEQERRLRPLVRHFDAVRAQRTAPLRSVAVFSPPLELVMAADVLAGHDAARQLRFQRHVDRIDDAWRGFFVPRIMRYRGMTPEDFANLPPTGILNLPVSAGITRLFGALLIAIGLLLLATQCLKRGLRRP